MEWKWKREEPCVDEVVLGEVVGGVAEAGLITNRPCLIPGAHTTTSFVSPYLHTQHPLVLYQHF